MLSGKISFGVVNVAEVALIHQAAAHCSMTESTREGTDRQ